MRGAQLVPRVPPPLGPAQPLAVEQVCTCEVDRHPGSLELADGFQVAALRVRALSQQRLAAGAQPERPGRAGGERPFGQGFVGGGRGFVIAVPDGGLDQLRQGHLGRVGRVVLDHGLRGGHRRRVVSAEQVGQGDDVPADVRWAALASCGRLADLGQARLAGLGEVAAVGEQQAAAAAVDAEHAGTAAHGQHLQHQGPAGIGLAEVAGHGFRNRVERQRDRQGRERPRRARHFYPAVGQIEGGLVIPQAAGGRGAEREPAKAHHGIEVVGEQRGHGGAERLNGGLVAEGKPGAVSLEQQVAD